MAATNEVILGTEGEDVEVNTKVDLTPYSTVSLVVREPDGTIVVWGASFLDADPTNGILTHTLEEGDMDQPGTYLIHGKVENASGALRYTNMTSLNCVELFNHPHG